MSANPTHTAKESFSTVKPANGEKIATYECQSLNEAKKGVDFSNAVYKQWKKVCVTNRAEYFRALAKVL